MSERGEGGGYKVQSPGVANDELWEEGKVRVDRKEQMAVEQDSVDISGSCGVEGDRGERVVSAVYHHLPPLSSCSPSFSFSIENLIGAQK